MRDIRFVALHRGGLLPKNHHKLLMTWAVCCSEHILEIINDNIDSRLLHALDVAKNWAKDTTTVGEAMKASVEAHAVARESTNPIFTAVARSIGHAVATAHMADHSLGAALYALKAVKLSGKSLINEREWQTKQLDLLPTEIADLVKTTLLLKEKSFKFL